MKNEAMLLYRYCRAMLLLAGVASLIGCVEEESEQRTNDTPHSLAVNVSLEGRSIDHRSRAIGIADIDLAATGFSALGYRTDAKFADGAATAAPSLLENVPQAVTQSVDNKFKIALPQTNPATGSTISFFAWAGAATGATTVGKQTTGWPWIKTSVGSAISTQTDLVAAATINVNNEYIVSAVDLNFKHILSKLSFKAKSASGAGIEILSAQLSTPASTVYGTAQFTFNGSDSLGVWSTHTDYQAAATVSVNRETTLPTLNDDVVSELGEALFIPQPIASGRLKLVLKYKILSGDATSKEITREVVLKAIHLRQNYNYAYTLSIGTDKIELSDPRIIDWIEAGEEELPIMTGPRDNVQLLLDGREPPYVHTDGYTYWLDRSGWNRHVKLNTTVPGKGYVSYDGIKKCYRFNGQCQSSPYDTYGGIIPPLGEGEEMVADIVCEGDVVQGTSWQTPIYLSRTGTFPIANDNRQFWCHFGDSKTEKCYVDKNGYSENNRLVVAYASNQYAQQKAHWTVVNTDQRLALYRNGTKGGTKASPKYTLGSLAKNHLAPVYVGNIYYLKLTRSERTDEEIAAEFASLDKAFNIPTVSVYEPPVRDNLGLNLNGFVEPQPYASTTTVWHDLSSVANHAQIMKGKEVTRNGYGYLFNKSVLILSKKFDQSTGLKSGAACFTVEVVMRPTKAKDFTIYRAVPSQVGVKKHESIYMNGNGTWYNISEYGTGRYQATYDGVPVTLGEVQTFTFVVDPGLGGNARKQLYKNGEFKAAVGNTGSLGAVDVTFIGASNGSADNPFEGIMYELRIHKRALTAAEVKTNYDWDKARYDTE